MCRAPSLSQCPRFPQHLFHGEDEWFAAFPEHVSKARATTRNHTNVTTLSNEAYGKLILSDAVAMPILTDTLAPEETPPE